MLAGKLRHLLCHWHPIQNTQDEHREDVFSDQRRASGAAQAQRRASGAAQAQELPTSRRALLLLLDLCDSSLLNFLGSSVGADFRQRFVQKASPGLSHSVHNLRSHKSPTQNGTPSRKGPCPL